MLREGIIARGRRPATSAGALLPAHPALPRPHPPDLRPEGHEDGSPPGLASDGVVLTLTDISALEQARSRDSPSSPPSCESSDDAIIGKTLDGIVTSWNDGAERLYGYREAEVIGRHVGFLYPPDAGADIESALAAVREGGAVERLADARASARTAAGSTSR